MRDYSLNAIEYDVHNLEENLKGKGRKPFKKIGDKIKEAAKNLSDNDAVYLPIVPFKNALKKRLDKKGVKYASNHISDIAKAFYKSEIEGSNFESYLNETEKTKGNDVEIPTSVVGAAAKIVEAVINFIKQKKEDKTMGKTGAADDELILDVDDAARAAEALTAEQLRRAAEFKTDAKSDVKTESEPMMSGTNILILVAIVVAVYFFSK